ncbi:hypothetical protein Gasu2_34170 [Galdieria sulphuraria]|nr:hypothetical protein Gasu2_34170 [Galdieria sulphuraria]
MMINKCLKILAARSSRKKHQTTLFIAKSEIRLCGGNEGHRFQRNRCMRITEGYLWEIYLLEKETLTALMKR